MARRVDEAALEAEIRALHDLSHRALQQKFLQQYKSQAPKRIGRKLLILAVAFEIQRKAYGLRNDRVNALRARLGRPDHSRGNSKNSLPRKTLKSGGWLVREWRDKSYEVYVADDGCYLEGKRYSSLSAVAFAITGVKRNGPAFFGLRSSRVPS